MIKDCINNNLKIQKTFNLKNIKNNFYLYIILKRKELLNYYYTYIKI